MLLQTGGIATPNTFKPQGAKMLNDLFTGGLRKAVRLVVTETMLYNRHRKAMKAASTYVGKHDLKLNIGCGPNRKNGWVNIDLLAHMQADLTLDVRERLPFENGSVALIYSEHFLEHLDYPEPTKQFLKESYRVLTSGGIFSVGVPDTQWPLHAYI